MSGTVITPEALYFGSPVSLLIDGVEMGATLDHPKIGFEIEKYAPRFKNAAAPAMGATVVKSVVPTLECLVNELSAAKIAHAMPGSTQVVGTAAETGAGADTTLAADAAIGATNIKVVAVTAMAVGDFIRIGDVGETEIHKITVVGTIGSGGTGVTIDAPLVRGHDTDDQVREVDDAGTTVFTWTIGRVPEDAFVEIVAIGLGLDGRQMVFTLHNALAGDTLSFPLGDDDFYGLPLKFVGNVDPATPRVVPFQLEIG